MWLQVGRLGRADFTVAVDPAECADLSSPQEAAMWRDAIRVNDELLSAVCDKVVLLVVDASSSQWPITVAAAHLRRARHRWCCRCWFTAVPERGLAP